MSTFTDVTVTDATWVDLYAITGAVTTATLLVQNKGSIPVFYQEAVSSPASNSTNGMVIDVMSPIKIITLKSGEKAWVKAFDKSGAVDNTTLAVTLG